MKDQIKKPRGGHNRGQVSPRSQGSGPVYEIRMQARLTQAELAQKLECSRRLIQNCEREGNFPDNERIMRNLLRFAHENGFDYSTII